MKPEDILDILKERKDIIYNYYIPYDELKSFNDELVMTVRDFLDIYFGGEPGNGKASKLLDK